MASPGIKESTGTVTNRSIHARTGNEYVQQYGQAVGNSMSYEHGGYSQQVVQSMYGYTHPPQKKQAETKSVLPLASGKSLQKKLSIGSPDDSYEKEADAVADQVMRMPEPAVQRKCVHCEAEEKLLQRKKIDVPAIVPEPVIVQRKCAACEAEEKPMQRKTLFSRLTPHIQAKGMDGGVANEEIANEEISNQIHSRQGKGNPMQDTTRNYMESRFGADFGNIRVHTDSQAIQLSQQLNAQAFATGNDIYFNQGNYSPESSQGKHLLAHELTHVVQQSGNKNVLSKKETDKKDKKEILIAKWYGNINETLYHFIIPVCTSKEEAAKIVAQILKNDTFIYHLKSGEVTYREYFEFETNKDKANTIYINKDAFKIISEATGKSREDFIKAINAYQKFEQLDKQANEMAKSLDLPYKNSWLNSFLEGAAESSLKEKAPEAWEKIKANATSWETGPHFYAGVIVGYPAGVVEDLWENIKGIVVLAWQLIKANYELQTDPIGFYTKLKHELSGLWQVLEADPKELGTLAGNALAEKLSKELIKVSAFKQGFHLGEMVGMIVTEVALLFIGVEEVLALAKAAEGTRLGALIAKGLKESETLAKVNKFVKGEKGLQATEEASKGINELQKLEEAVRKAQKAAGEKVTEDIIRLENKLLEEKAKDITNLKEIKQTIDGSVYTKEIDAGEHTYRQRKDGVWCRFTEKICNVKVPENLQKASVDPAKLEKLKDIKPADKPSRLINQDFLGTADLDTKLTDMALAERKLLIATEGVESFERNVAVARVKIGEGNDFVYIVKANARGGLHSEQLILSEMHELKKTYPKSEIKIDQLYSERIPCLKECIPHMKFNLDKFPSSMSVFYHIGPTSKGNKMNNLMEVYGLTKKKLTNILK